MNDKLRLLLHQLEDQQQQSMFVDADQVQELINEIKDYLFIHDDDARSIPTVQ